MMENIWLASAVWIGLALASALISIRVALSVALIEIMVRSEERRVGKECRL